MDRRSEEKIVEPPVRTGTTQQAVWTNGDFEDDAIGTTPPTGWTVATRLGAAITDLRPGVQTLPSLNLGAGGTLMSKVVGGAPESQTDPDLGALGTLRFPKYGQRAVRVNYLNSTAAGIGKNKNANYIQQQMTVGLGDVDPTDNKVHVRFAVAPILENPNHGYSDQPYYFVRLRNVTSNTMVYQDFNASGQPGVPWKDFTDPAGVAAQYTDWQLVDIAPGDAMLATGDVVELTVVAAGCAPGGHWGRVYVDAVGSGIPGLFTWATGPQQANAGSNITYSVNYKNGGTTATTGTTLDFVTPPNTTFQSVSLGSGCTRPAVNAAGTISCPLGSLANGATGSYTVTVKVLPGTAVGTVITNGNYSIYAAGVSALIGPKAQTTVTSGTQYADLGISVTDGIAAIGWGQSLRYTVVVTNAGPVTAPSVRVTDPLPTQIASSTWTCAATGGGACTASGSGSLNDAAVVLPVGATVTYTIDAVVKAGSGPGKVINTANVVTVGAITDPDTTNNTALDTDDIGTPRLLTLTKTGLVTAGTMSSTPALLSCGAACATTSGSFLDGSQVLLTVAPTAGSLFLGWGGDCSGTASTCTVTMSAARSVTASFAGPATVATINGGDAQHAATGATFAAPLSVLVADSVGTAVPGVVVTFAGPSSGASASIAGTATTNGAGIASVAATANAVAGPFTATATAAGITPPLSFALTNHGPPSTIAVTAGTPQSTTVATAFATALAVVVRDTASQPVAGATVTFSVTGSTASASLSALTATTDATGAASVSANANNRPGAFTASAAVAGVAAPASFALTNTVAAATTLTVSSGGTQTATVGTAFSGMLVAAVTDTYGNPVPGTVVSFLAPLSGASAALTASSATTDSAGLAQVGATANGAAGSYAVAASVPGITPASFALGNTPGAAATVAVTGGGGQLATVGAAFGAPISVIVLDAYGNGLPGITVTFTGPGSGATATVGSAVTDATGTATTSATASTTAGTYVVTAAAGPSITAPVTLTNVAGGPTSLVATAGSSQSATVSDSFPIALTVHAADAHGNAVPSVLISFAAPIGALPSADLAASSMSTDASGNASVGATANTMAGGYTITATTGSLSASFTLTNTAGAVANLEIVTGSGQSTQVGTAFAVPLAVLVSDAHHNAVQGAIVAFTRPSSGASVTLGAPSATTDALGTASISATANTTAGGYAVTATTTGAAPVLLTLTNLTASPGSITVASGSGQSAAVLSSFAAPLVITVSDAYGNAVAGTVVTFAASPSATLSSQVATTDAAGHASVTATANARAEAYTITVSAPGVVTPATFALTNVAGAAASIAAVGGDGQTAPVLTQFAARLTALVTDAQANPVAGVTVTFTAPSSGPSATLDTPSAMTDVSGHASVDATADITSGGFVVTASAAGATPSATFSLTNGAAAAASVAVTSGSGQTATVAALYGAILVARVSDVHGNPIAGATVTFSSPGAGASATLGSVTAITDATGHASTSATASFVAGSYSVTAASAGASSAFFSLTNVAGAAANVDVVSGTGQSATAGSAFGASLVVRVTDVHGNAVSGQTVSYTLPLAGASASLTTLTATTDALGEAQVTATALTTAGAYTITATVPGAVTPATFALTNLAGLATTVTAQSGNGQSSVVGTSFGAPLVARVTDAHGNPVAGVTIVFATTASGASATLSVTSAISDASGLTSVQATAGNTAGTYDVSATATGLTSASFSLTNQAAAAATIAVASGNGQSAAVTTVFGGLLTVSVADTHGNPVAGATVTFTTPSSGATATLASADGTVSTSTATTDAAGHASLQATGGTLAGSFSVAAAIGSGASATFTLTDAPGPAAHIAALDGDGQSTTVGTVFGTALVATVTDAHGNAVPGALVALSAPSAGATATFSQPTAVTDASGHVSFLATASVVSGSYTVTASVNGVGVNASFNLDNVADSGASIVVSSGNPQSAMVTAAFAQALTVTVTDIRGNRVAGATVLFHGPALGASASLPSSTVVTSATGEASVVATANGVAGSYAVTASLAGTHVQFDLTNLAGPASSIVAVSGGSQSAPVGAAFTPLVARVTDAQGNPVAGSLVTFTAPTSGATASLASPTVTTGSDGRATVTATAGTTAGAFDVTATAGGIVTAAHFSLTSTASSAGSLTVVSGAGQSQAVGALFASPLVVLAADTHGNPIPGATVTFAVPLVGASAVLGAFTAVTDTSGRASSTATAGSTSGAYAVTATLEGVAPATFALTNTPGAASGVTVAGGDAQSAVVMTAFATPLEVLVRDSNGNAVSGVSVTFRTSAVTPAASAALSGEIAITTADGKARVTATANLKAGTYAVTASVEGGSSTSFALTNLAGAPHALVAAAESAAQAGTVLQPFAHPLRVTVVDMYGNPIPNVTVTFTAPLAPATAALGAPSATTDAQGEVSVTAQASGVVGSYFVSAAVNGVADTAAFALSNVAGSPSIITATAGALQSAVVDADLQPLVASVTDSEGNPVADVVVTFTAPSSSASALLASSAVVTDAAGRASTAARAGTVTGAYVVSASMVGGSSNAAFAITNLPGAPATVVAAASSTPQTAAVRTPFPAPLVAIVTDAWSNAVPGALVTYVLPTVGATGTMAATTATTDATGRTSLPITAGTLADEFSVNASVVGVARPATFALTNAAGPPSALSIVSGSSQTTIVNTDFSGPLLALVMDSFGNPVPHAEITFVAPPSGVTAVLSAPSATTDAAGKASVTATAGTRAGSYAVSASSAGTASPVMFALTNTAGAAATITARALATPQSTRVGQPFATPLAVTVTDAFGNAVGGTAVRFEAPSGGTSAALSAPGATTDARGHGQVLAIANQRPGSFTVRASCAGVAVPALFALTNTVGAPTQLVVVSGGGQHATATTAFASPLRLRAMDGFGNPVTAVAVRVTAPVAGPSASLPGEPLVTDDHGDVSVALVANANVGSFDVTAEVSGASAPVHAAMTIDAIPTITLVTTKKAEGPVDESFEIGVSVSSTVSAPTGAVRLELEDGTSLGSAPLVLGEGKVAVARVSLQLPSRGQHTVTVHFDAQSSFGASEGTLPLLAVSDSGSLSGGSRAACSMTSAGSSSSAAGTSAIALVFALAMLLARRLRARGSRSPRLARRLGAAAFASVLIAAGPASAEDPGGIAIDRFHAAAAGSRWFAADSLSFQGHLDPALSVIGDYAHGSLITRRADGSHRAEIVRHSLVVHAGASVTVYDRIRLSLTVPFSPYQDGEAGTFNGLALAPPSGGLGDVGVAADVRVYGEPHGLVRASVGAKVSLPTGSRSDYLGDGVVGFEPRVMLAGSAGFFEYGAQASALVRPHTDLAGVRFGSEMRFVVAAGVRALHDKLLVGPELLQKVALESATGNGSPAEAWLGAHYAILPTLDGGLGAGLGLANAAGSPDQRVLLSLTWSPRAAANAPTASASPPPRQAEQHAELPAGLVEAVQAVPTPPKSAAEEVAATPAVVAPSERLDERVHFALDRASLAPTQEPALRAVLAVMRTRPDHDFRIEGHADESGSHGHNTELSEARARAVRDWLVGRGVSASRLEVVGFGSEQPRERDGSWAAHAENRRVEFLLVPDSAKR